MAMNTSPVFPHGVNNGQLDIENGDGTSYQTVVTGAADGTRVKLISISSDDTSDRYVKFSRKLSGGASCVIGVVLVPDGSGTNGTDQAVDGLNQTNMPWLREDRALVLASGEVLEAAVLVAVTAAKTVQIFVEAEDY